MAQSNGASHAGSTSTPGLDVSTILQALEMVHNPVTKNDQRKQASEYLEQLKQHGGIANAGFELGKDQQQSPLVRYFGLSLLEHVLRHQFHSLGDPETESLRRSVLTLGASLESTTQAFVRNKIATLWIELAKRSWALDWFDLDEYLVQVWHQGNNGREFVLLVLENLSEDVFVREDSTILLRERDLNDAVVEIFTSSSNHAGGIKTMGMMHRVRYGDEGWLNRITVMIDAFQKSNSLDTASVRACVSALGTLRSAFAWVMTPAVSDSACLPIVCACLTSGEPAIQLAAVEALLSLYGRPRLEQVEVQALVYPLCQPGSVAALTQVYTHSIVGVDETQSTLYTISKKLSELVYHLTGWIIHYEPPSDVDFVDYLKFIILVAQHESLIVSIAAAHSWDKLLQSAKWRRTPAIQACIEPVLKFAMQRIVAYDQMSDEVEEPAVVFVNEEIELHPERQGFYLNYRRFCYSIVDWICYTFLDDALSYILQQADQLLGDMAAVSSSSDPSEYNRSSRLVLQADAQFTVVEAAFKGLDRWRRSRSGAQGEVEMQTEAQWQRIEERIRSWSLKMLSDLTFSDPVIRQRQIKNVVEISSKVLNSDTGFALKVLEYILTSFLPFSDRSAAWSEAVGELHSYASAELRKLSLEHATYFLTVYEQLEERFNSLSASSSLDEKVQIDLKSTLFLIVQRASGIDRNVRLSRLRHFVGPLASAWVERESLLSSFEAFCASQAFDQVGPFIQQERAVQHPDWSAIGFGPGGANIQAAMSDGAAQIPLRQSRVLLSVSTDRLQQDPEAQEIVRELWEPLLSIVLQHVCRLTSYNHRLHDPSTWPNAQPGLSGIIQKILRDRYWQSGISGGSMNDFHARVKATRSTMEGFASSVRGRIRVNLENCYSIIHTLGRLGSPFYSLRSVPEYIAETLIDTASPLSTHHFGTLLSMLPKLIEECPPNDRQNFLPPLLASLLRQMDTKCTSEWERLNSKQSDERQEDELSDEMREESVLRQMTYRAVNMVSFWIDPQRELLLSESKRIVNISSQSSDNNPPQSLRDFVLSNLRIIEPLLLFCTHAISYKDTKTCATMVVALQKLVPAYANEAHLQGQDAAAVREFISTETLRSALMSLHDGYFADYQNQLAVLIANIWTFYGLPTHVAATETQPAHDRPAWTNTPRNVLLSIPGLEERRVEEAAAKLRHYGAGGRSQKLRAVILDLLEGVRGVRVSELGKIDMKQQQSKLMEKYVLREAAGVQGVKEGRNGSKADQADDPDFGGLANMFG